MEIKQQFGEWFLMKPEKIVSYKYYECRCKCGLNKMVRGDGLLNGRSTRCRECRDNSIYLVANEYIGKKFGKLTVTKDAEPTKNKQRQVIVRCECGSEKTITISRLKIKKPKACHICNVKKHGYEGTPTYNTWRTMKYRCYQKTHPNYKNYGARGITICDEWRNSFENFLADMGEKPKGYQIDRVDNNGNYEPSNCRWVTPKENSNNRRKRPVLWKNKLRKQNE